jgi:parvulin-like peptidyl-prolyl isomerase
MEETAATGVRSRRAFVLLVSGAALGALLAAVGLDLRGTHRLPAGVVAMVDGVPIRHQDYLELSAALAADTGGALNAVERRRIIDRLIDEELLLQRGLALGLARHDRRVRGEITQAVIDQIVAEAGEREPSDQELAQFYAVNRDFFAGAGALRVRQVFVPAATGGDLAARARAEEAAARVRAGQPIDLVEAALGDAPLAPVPDALLPPNKLRDYLGPTALRTALALATGEVSQPVRSASGYHVLQVVDRVVDGAPALADVRAQVREEFQRRAGERALRAYLDDVRREAEITVVEPLP